jgi:hypothetical protein
VPGSVRDVPKVHNREKTVETDQEIDLLRAVERAVTALDAGLRLEPEGWFTLASVYFEGGSATDDRMEALRPELTSDDLASIDHVSFICHKGAGLGITIRASTGQGGTKFTIIAKSEEEHFVWGWLEKLKREIEADIKDQAKPVLPPPPPPPPSLSASVGAGVSVAGFGASLGRTQSAEQPEKKSLLHNPWVLAIVPTLVIGVLLVILEVSLTDGLPFWN